jgi:hypothetical protein
MFIWSSLYIGVAAMLIAETGSVGGLLDALTNVAPFRDTLLELVFLFVVYSAFGLVALRYEDSALQRRFLLIGPAVMAALFAATFVHSVLTPLPGELGEIFSKGQTTAYGFVKASMAGFLALLSIRFVLLSASANAA